MASASGSMAAARGRKEVGERVWMCGGGAEGVEDEDEDEEGRKWEASFWRRVAGEDILRLVYGSEGLRWEEIAQWCGLVVGWCSCVCN